jgi:Tol biopolymer transport system component
MEGQMKHYQCALHVFLLFFVIWITSCSTAIEQSKSSTTVQPTSLATEVQTAPTPKNQMQITYIQNQENSGELYAIDVACLTDKPCFGEPILLLQTLTMPSGVQSEPKGLLTDYDWSPVENKIVLVSAGDLLIGDMKTKTWVNITNTSAVDEYEPKWSSDGKFIYYRACPLIIEGNYGGHGDCHLYRYNLAEKDTLDLLRSMNNSLDSYDISPDGQKVVFTSKDKKGDYQINQARLDGSDFHQLTRGEMDSRTPSYSPDSRKILFVRSNKLLYADTKSVVDIILMDLATGAEKNLTENFDGEAFSPVFSFDGKWIAFDSSDTNLNWNIFLVSLDQADLIQVTRGNQEVWPAWRRLFGR